MRILFATDAFKDSLSARQVAFALRNGFQKVLPEASFEIAPMADGGEGTVESVIDATDGELIRIPVMDPLMRERESFYGITGDQNTAVIEMAAASGIELLPPSERNPWITSTFGTGQLIRDALNRGCRKILLGIGGSATNDCGAGMAEALGVKILDREGNVIGKGGGELGNVTRIIMEELDPRISSTDILVACDVSNPLTGPRGASFIYGPQKGADQEMVHKLDENLNHFARIIRSQLGKEIADLPGAGAAGGLGAGLMAFLDARLVEGFEIIAKTVRLEEKIKRADLVITGEGKIDSQTRFGKTPFGVAQLATKHQIPVVAVAGSVEDGAEILHQMGFQAIMPILEKPGDLEFAIQNATLLLERAGERIARLIAINL